MVRGTLRGALGIRYGLSLETAEKVIAELGKSYVLYEVELAAVAPTEGPGDDERSKAVLAEKANPAALGKRAARKRSTSSRTTSASPCTSWSC